MGIVNKVGYITILYWGYRFSRNLFYRIVRMVFPSQAYVDVCSMGKWAVITGCSHGIGKAYVETFAKMGLNIVLINLEEDGLKAIAHDIETLYNVKTRSIKLNFSDGMDAYKNIEKEILGLEVGILINNLGISNPHPEYFLDLPHKEKIYMNIIQCNIVVLTNMCRIVLPQMVVRGKGIVVNVASTVAVIPSPLLTVFAATKAYVLKFSRDLQIEYGKQGIIVQCLLPGTVTNHTSDSPKPGWMVPTPDKYVHNAICTIGKENVTTGFFPHSILVGIIKLIHRLSPTFVVLWMMNIMESNRNNALRRYVG